MRKRSADSRRDFLRKMGTSSVLAAGLLPGITASAETQSSSVRGSEALAASSQNDPRLQALEQAFSGRPNILWVSCEDMSPRLGCYGDPIADTPNIDRLARQGVRYDNAFTVAPVCAPNRSAIITGMNPPSIGTHHMRTTHTAPGLPTPYSAVPPPFVKGFTEYLRSEGYYTTNNAKEDYQFETPESLWHESSNQAHWRSDQREDGQPFFSVFNFSVTHESHVWPDPDEELQTDPSEVEVPPYYPDTQPVREDLARHYDDIARMDRRVGEMLDQLEEDGLTENTIVFFWSDHGEGLPRAKRWPYDSGIHIPLIVRAPDYLEAGSTNDDLVSSVDFGPTVLSLAGVPIPRHMQGQPFLGPAADVSREYIYAHRDRYDESYDMVRAIRDKRFKYIRNYYPDKPYVLHVPYRNRMRTMQELLRLDKAGELEGPARLWMRDSRPPEELYDTVNDPHEVNNLADDPAYAEELDRLRDALDDWMDRIDDMGELPEVEMVEQWWPGGEQPETHPPIVVDQSSTSMEGIEARSFDEPVQVALHCPTQGASVVYTTEEGADPHWKLYRGPLVIQETTTLRTKAIRYGYAESSEVTAQIEIV